jgi:hypothetical protein
MKNISWSDRRLNQAVNSYLQGRNIPRGPHYPVPAKLYEAHLCDREYPGLMWIDEVSCEEDPIMVWGFNMFTGKPLVIDEGCIIEGGW